MRHTTKSFSGYQIRATDADVGEVKEFYFDDQTWAVRYLIVETGNWLTGRKVLLSPQSLLAADAVSKVFPVNLSKDQIRSSPEIDTDKPVSHRMEATLFQHYAWERYGGGGFYAGGAAGLLNVAPLPDETDTLQIPGGTGEVEFDPHLRSTERVTDYHIHATDGDIGHVKDFIIDDQSWTITELIIDTHNWIGGKKIMLPVKHIKRIDWANFKVFAGVTSDFIRECAVFNEEKLNPSIIYAS